MWIDPNLITVGKFNFWMLYHKLFCSYTFFNLLDNRDEMLRDLSRFKYFLFKLNA